MIIDILKIIIPYFSGMVVTFLMFHPLKEWKDGYKVAKEHYNNWNLGFEEGFKCARKHFQNFDEGFGEGFESGWDVAFKYYKTDKVEEQEG